MKRTSIILIIILPLLGIMSLMSALQLHAIPTQSNDATFNVNSTVDATDATPGDGICETEAGNNICTLRAAIQETNALPGADVINLPSGVYSITLSGTDSIGVVGDFNITDSLKILGEGKTTTIVDGNNLDRVFDIRMDSEKEATLTNLTIQNGKSEEFGGGICNCTSDTILYLNNVFVYKNQSLDGYGSQTGVGGIHNEGFMELINSRIQENIGGLYGGGINNNGIAIIHKSNIISNSASVDGIGGGVLNQGTITITNSTIHGNSVIREHVGNNGGGIANLGDDARITVESSTISNNYAIPDYSFGVGGFINYTGIARLINVTVSGNDKGAVTQAGIGTLYITNTSIISNMHYPINHMGSIFVNGGGSLSLANTIIAGESSVTNCYIYGSFVSNGNNLDSGNSCGLNNSEDITNTNPMIGSLQWNGGDTQTHALLEDSPAIDNGNNSACPITDQRGVLRPSGNHCDIGAYEFDFILTAIDDTANTQQNISVLIDVLANDIPGANGDPFLGSVGTPLSGTAVISDTFVLYTSTLDFVGSDYFTYTITDGVDSDTAFITVTISAPPTAVSDTITTTQNTPVLIPVLENDLPGNNGDPFLDNVGTPMSGMAVISNTFVLYTPTLDFGGTDYFTYTITDGVESDTAFITVTVSIPPTAVFDAITTTQNTPVLIPVLENDLPGNNGDPYLDNVGTPMSGTAVISDTFVLYTPTLDISGTDIFSYTISDGVITDTTTIFVTISPIDETFYIYLPAILKPEG